MKNLFVLALLLFSNLLISQELDVDFGDVNMSDLEMTVYDADSSATAVVLFDKGRSFFKLNKQSYSLDLNFETHIRIKILHKDALSRGTFKIPLYHRNGDKEKVTSYKGYTINLENGKIKKSKLKKSNRFIEEVDENNTTITYTFPDVKVGSVIDFKYNKTSDFPYNLEDWYFQSDIPVIWSEYIVVVPEYYNYYKNNKGYIPPFIYDVNTTSRRHNITNKSRSGTTNTKTEFSTSILSYQETEHRYVYRNIPAFKNESYIGSPNDYMSQVSFELKSVKFPNSPIQTYSSTYESITKELLEHSKFGEQIDGSRFLKREVEAIQSKHTSPAAQMQAAFDLIKNTIKWNDYYGKYATTTIKEVYNDKEGNVGGINLLLTSLLRELDIDASPVVLSTRGNGKIPITHPSVTSFNYTIVHVTIDGKEYLLDATSPYLAVNELRSYCSNEKGRLIKKDGGRWIDIDNNSIYKRNEMVSASFNPEGDVIGKRRVSNVKYAAYSKRSSIDEDGGVDKYFEEYQENNIDYNYENYEVKNLEKISSPLSEVMSFSYHVHDNDDVVYFNPMLSFKVSENPFVQESRIYPIDYPYLSDEKYMIQLNIPEDYQIDELPEQTKIVLPENAGMFIYLIAQNGNKLLITSQIKINKKMFLPEEYKTLKEFYKSIVDKHSEVIVLKKSDKWAEKIQ